MGARFDEATGFQGYSGTVPKPRMVGTGDASSETGPLCGLQALEQDETATLAGIDWGVEVDRMHPWGKQ